MGRYRGGRNSAPVKGSITERIVRSWDRSPASVNVLARRCRTTASMVHGALNRWREGWQDVKVTK